jgi:TPR repeat protein
VSCWDDGEVEYWERVADGGDVDAMLRVADLLREADPSRSAMWLKRAAKAGNSNAALTLGYELADSDPVEAARWYRSAAEAGEVGAMFNLGLLLRTKDRTESRRWLEQAALRDHSGAMNALGLALAPWHLWASFRWSRLAADKGDANAMVRMASWADARRLVALGPKRRRLLEEKLAWLLTAAELNHIDAMWQLALHYGDIPEGRRWIQAAADQGDQPAQRVLTDGWSIPNFWRHFRPNRGQAK